MWKAVRVGILLMVLGVVASNAWIERHRAVTWRDSLYVGIYPVATDDRPATQAYIRSLQRETFLPLEAFFAGEARRYRPPADRCVSR